MSDLTKVSQLLAEVKEALERRKKYIKKEYQAYGLKLASELNDWKNRSLYIKLAKTLPRRLLEQAFWFVKDQPPEKVKNKARLFMWKLTQLKKEAAQ